MIVSKLMLWRCPASPRTVGKTVQQDEGMACPHCRVPSVCVHVSVKEEI